MIGTAKTQWLFFLQDDATEVIQSDNISGIYRYLIRD